MILCNYPFVNESQDIASNDDGEVSTPHEGFSNQLQIKELRELSHFLDQEVENVKGGVFLSQESQGEKIVLQIQTQ